MKNLIKRIKIKIFSLLRHQGFIKYFKNTVWLIIEKILQIIAGLFVSIWVARYLGPERYGLLSYAVSFAELFTIFATLGLEGIIVREIIKKEEESFTILGTSFVLKSIGATIIFIPLFIATRFTKNDNFTNLLIFIIASATLFQGFNVINFYFQAKVLNKYIAIVNIITLFIISTIKIILIIVKADLLLFAIVIVLQNIISGTCLVYFFKLSNIKKFKFDYYTAIQLLKYSLPQAFSSVVLIIQAKIDQVMLKEMINTTQVGYYSIALNLISFFGFIPMVLKTSLYPAIQNAKKVSDELYKKRLLNFYRLNFLLFLICAIPIYFFSKIIIVFLYGKEYYPAGELLSLMSTRLFFANMGVARGVYILIENLLTFSFITMVFGTITNIMFNYFLIPWYSAKGAIIATIISFFVTIFFIDIFYYKTRPNFFLMFKGIITFYKIKI